MNLSELNNLDLNNAAAWPLPIKLFVSALILVLVVAGGWYLDWSAQTETLEQLAGKEQQLRKDFEKKQAQAANLEAYEQQLVDMNASFGAMLKQLPSKAEISKLLVDISQTGLASGLEFELFRPGGETKRDFYAEMPVSIRVRGNYHQFARFVSGVANLPRIVTIHDVGIQSPTSGKLTMDLTAKTYWYVDEGAGAK